MKNLLLLFVILPFVSSAQNNCHIRGVIKHQLADTVEISYNTATIDFIPVKYKAKLQNSQFDISFNIPIGYTQLKIQNGDQETELFAEPGTDLTMAIDAANFDSTLTYTGKGSEIANFCARYVLEQHTARQVDMNAQQLCRKELPDYLAAIKELLKNEDSYIDQNGGKAPAAFRQYLKNTRQYEVAYTMSMYPVLKEMFKYHSNSVKNIPKENYDVVDHIPVSYNDDYINSVSYMVYLTSCLSERLSAECARSGVFYTPEVLLDSFLAHTYREMPSLSAEYCAADRILITSKSLGLHDLTLRVAEYKSRFPYSKNIPVLMDAIAVKRKMAAGKPAIDFEITTPEGKRMKLSDLKGSVVYIDFWSRACVPCIGEMPSAKTVRDHFKGKPVSFVYVSLDEEETWRKAIADYKVEGINTHVDNGRESEVVKKYGVEGIPAYFLIDKNGLFANVQAVERPSETERLIAQIEKLLN
jgi:peroxiredoxin